MKNIIGLIILFISCSLSIQAQNYKLSGTVLDSLTNQPLVGANVALESTYEAGNIKGIKIEIPGNSNAADFGKAAAREVIESFGPREYKYFIEAFLGEFKKLTGGV